MKYTPSRCHCEALPKQSPQLYKTQNSQLSTQNSSPITYRLLLLAFFTFALLSATPALAQEVSQYGKIPAFFIENKGQTDNKAKYYFKGNDTVYFTDDGVMFQKVVRSQGGQGTGNREQESNNPPPSPFDKGGIRGIDPTLSTHNSLAYKLEFIGAKPTAPQARNELNGKVNYLIGNDRSKWHSNIPTYQEIVYPGLYPPICHSERSEESPSSGGIDLIYKGVPGGMKYEFIVQPGANPDDIRLAYTGIEGLSIDDSGNLIIHTSLGDVKDSKPYCYQEIDGKEVVVSASFRLNPPSPSPLIMGEQPHQSPLIKGGRGVVFNKGVCLSPTQKHNPLSPPFLRGINWSPAQSSTIEPTVREENPQFIYGFTIASYNKAYPLIIDPGLEYSTYLGGSSGDAGSGIAVDGSGNAYVTGYTTSGDFPTTAGAFDTNNSSTDAFVTKLNTTGTALEYSTFLGGSGGDEGSGIAVDGSGNAYVTGGTGSSDFPTTAGAFDTSHNGILDVFVTKLNTTGTALAQTCSPTLLGSHDTPDDAFGVYVSGSTAYVTAYWSGLRIIDVSNPANPALLGSYDMPSLALGIYVSGNTAYVANYGSGLQIIDVSNPANPTLLGSYDTPDGADGVYVSGSTAYVADGYSGLQIIDVSNPANPTLLGSYDTPGVAVGVYVSGSTAYVADWTSGLQIIDVSNPANPTLLGSYDTPDFARGVYVSGNVAYVADWGSGLQIIDVNPASPPKFLGNYDTPGSAWSVYVSGTTAYVADREGGLQIIDVSNPANPTLLGSYDTPGVAFGIYVSGTTAYVAGWGSGLQIIDVTGCRRVEICDNGIDDDNDGLVDCDDPECCGNAACFGNPKCNILSETLLSRQAVMSNVEVTAPDFQGTSTLNFTDLEFVKITTGSFAEKGFSKGACEATLEGAAYTGEWNGVTFLKPLEKKIYLKGAVTGQINATVEGYLTESVPNSNIYDKYQATWKIGRLGGADASATINVNGAISYQDTEYPNTELYLLQANTETTPSGDYDPDPLNIVLTHLRVVKEDNPYVGEGFSIISYNSNSGAGQGWTYDRLLFPGMVEMKGLFSSPLYGVATATLDDSSIPRTLSLRVERIDLGIPPMADLEVRTWGPRRVSPGQTVDYIVEYRNDGVKDANDVIVVLQLNQAVEYLSSTNNGIYRLDKHEVFWKLGTIPPKSRGILTAKVVLQRGLPHVMISNIALIATNSDEVDKYLYQDKIPTLDVTEYLEYPNIITHIQLTNEEFESEVLSNQLFSEIFNQVIKEGYYYTDLAMRTIMDNGTIVNVALLYKNNPLELLFINQYEQEKPLIMKMGVNTISFGEKEGGITFDFTYSNKFRISCYSNWCGKLNTSNKSPNECTTSNCVVNGIIDKLPMYLVEKVSKTISTIMGVKNCLECDPTTPEGVFSCAKCSKFVHDKLYKETPLVGEIINLTEVITNCVINKNQYSVPHGTRKRQCKQAPENMWNYILSIGSTDFFEWLLMPDYGTHYIAQYFFDAESSCRWHLDPFGGITECKSSEICQDGNCKEDPKNSEKNDTEIITARDPNIKYGPGGAVVAGQKLDYKVEFENEGEGIAFGVYFTDTLDEDLDDSTLVIGPVIQIIDGVVGPEIGDPGTYDPATRTITWFVSGEGEIGPNVGGYAEISVNVKSGAARGTEIINYGTVYFPSVPEETRTNAIVSRIPLIEDCSDGIDNDEDGLTDCDDPECLGQACPEVCDDGMDNDGDGFVDCADTDCDPCPEICDNGLDDDRDGLVDCDDPDCTCCDSTNYSRGTSSITFDLRRSSRDRASLKMCVNRAFCDALRAGPKDIVVRLDGCNQITIPGNKIRADRTKTVFSASSSTYTLKIDCRNGTLTLTLRNLALKACVSNPVKMCISIKDGPCLCAEREFVERRDRKGNGLSLNVKSACPR